MSFDPWHRPTCMRIVISEFISLDGIARRFCLESVTQVNTAVLCRRYLPAE
jgi:hypothetical protein